MPEWSKGGDSKSSRRRVTVSWVRIPPSPPDLNFQGPSGAFLVAERWLSGRRRSPGERVGGLKPASRVQIPPSPPFFQRSPEGLPVPCGKEPLTPPGPEGSNGTRIALGATGALGSPRGVDGLRDVTRGAWSPPFFYFVELLQTTPAPVVSKDPQDFHATQRAPFRRASRPSLGEADVSVESIIIHVFRKGSGPLPGRAPKGPRSIAPAP